MTAGLPDDYDPDHSVDPLTADDLVKLGLASKEPDPRTKATIYRISPAGYAMLYANQRIRSEEARTWRTSRH